MIFTLYIFPDVICGGRSSRSSADSTSSNKILNDDPNLRDPIDGICYALTNRQK